MNVIVIIIFFTSLIGYIAFRIYKICSTQDNIIHINPERISTKIIEDKANLDNGEYIEKLIESKRPYIVLIGSSISTISSKHRKFEQTFGGMGYYQAEVSLSWDYDIQVLKKIVQYVPVFYFTEFNDTSINSMIFPINNLLSERIFSKACRIFINIDTNVNESELERILQYKDFNEKKYYILVNNTYQTQFIYEFLNKIQYQEYEKYNYKYDELNQNSHIPESTLARIIGSDLSRIEKNFA
jgi:hypothetical protein